METADDAFRVITEHQRSLWALTALTLAVERGVAARLTEGITAAEAAAAASIAEETARGMLDVLVEIGLVAADGERYRSRPGFAAAAAGPRIAADLRTTLGFNQRLVEAARDRQRPFEGWRADDPVLVEAQAAISAGATEMAARLFMPKLPGLTEQLSASGASILDVGAGGAGGCIAYARAYPAARVVGIEPGASAIEVGRAAVARAGLADRIELRHCDMTGIHEDGVFDVAWVAQMFIPTAPLVDGLPRVLRAMRPGGWLFAGATCDASSGLASAIARFRTSAWGGAARTPPDVIRLLTAAGFTAAEVLPGPPGMYPIVARRPG